MSCSRRLPQVITTLLCTACVAPESPIPIDFGPGISRAVALTLDPQFHLRSASGLLEVPSALLVAPGERPVVLLGFDEARLPGPFSGDTSAPATLAVGCAPQLPPPSEAKVTDGSVVPPLPKLTAPWLEDSCPAPPLTLAVEDGDAPARCTMTITAFPRCGFEATLNRETCSTSGVVVGRAQPDGSVCATIKNGFDGCVRGTGSASLDCSAAGQGFQFFLPEAPPLSLERHPLGTGRALMSPASFTVSLDPGGVALRLVYGVSEGWLSDLALTGDAVAVIDHADAFVDARCERAGGGAKSEPDRVLFLDPETLAPSSSATIAPCATRIFANSRRDGWLVVHGGPTPSISVLDRAGRTRRSTPICPQAVPAVIAGADLSAAEHALGVVMNSVEIKTHVYFARFDEEGTLLGACQDIVGWWGNDAGNGAHLITDLFSLESDGWIVSDENIGGGWIFDGPRTSSGGPGAGALGVGARFTVHTGLQVPADIGFLGRLPDGRVMMTHHNRNPALELADLVGTTLEPRLVPHFISAAAPLTPVALAPERVATSLWWSQAEAPYVHAGLGLFLGPKYRAQPYELDLGPGLPGRMSVDRSGRLLLLMPWSSEIVRITTSP
ncbi:MAG: hypothetical protein U1E65_18975 [Myxococcota bacterium]